MHNITFAFLDQVGHGTAFRQYLELRKAFFVDRLGWDIPHNDSVEMDQYDNPCAHYSLVLHGSRVIGGARIMATRSSWGSHTYMLRDALEGTMGIPPEAIPDSIAGPHTWECTRLVMTDLLHSHADRAKCLSLVVGGLIEMAQIQGGRELVSLSPLPLMRTLRQLGFPASRLGEPYVSKGDGRRYAVLHMPVASGAHLIAAE